ncbi:hypothetical protein BCON_0016g00680 [Botryotinia convoluta]|uniref:Uncharacterized protein n=1 Tax=Botryotinia convoluta TaxID=54673 RepID=A0A4Z1INR8_9HELO|nr:hypothetical protein BCON_0016g00680 [Botryotinia convoluta]
MAGKNGRGRTGTGSKTPDFSSLPSRVIDYAPRLTVKPELLTAGERRCSDRRNSGFKHVGESQFADTNSSMTIASSKCPERRQKAQTIDNNSLSL